MTVARIAGVVLALGLFLAFFGTHGVIVVTGGSMQPALSHGDVAIFRRTSEVPANMLAVFSREAGGLVVHRVVGETVNGDLRTKGDANLTEDPVSVARTRVHGQVVAHIPLGRLLSRLKAELCYTSNPIAQAGCAEGVR